MGGEERRRRGWGKGEGFMREIFSPQLALSVCHNLVKVGIGSEDMAMRQLNAGLT